MSINRAFIAGNLTRDAELRRTNSDTPVLVFCTAFNDDIKNDQGEWVERPNYIDCSLYGKRAEAIAERMKKGVKVSLEGKLRWSQWEKCGQRRSKIELIVTEIEFMKQAEERDHHETQ